VIEMLAVVGICGSVSERSYHMANIRCIVNNERMEQKNSRK